MQGEIVRSIDVNGRLSSSMWISFLVAVGVIVLADYKQGTQAAYSIIWGFILHVIFIWVGISALRSLRFHFQEEESPDKEEYEMPTGVWLRSIDLIVVLVISSLGWLGVTPTYWLLRVSFMVATVLATLRYYSKTRGHCPLWLVLSLCLFSLFILERSLPRDSLVWLIAMGCMSSIVMAAVVHMNRADLIKICMVTVGFSDFWVIRKVLTGGV